MSEQEPTRGEVGQAVLWLRRHGVAVAAPTRLLATRLGVRGNAAPRGLRVRQAAVVAAAIACGVGYQCLQYLPGVRGVEMTESKMAYFIVIGIQAAAWIGLRYRDRQAAAWLGTRAIEAPVPPRRGLPGGWHTASAVVTFAGGAALGGTMFFATPYRTYAWSWLGVLALALVMSAVLVTGVRRRPVIAEDEASLAVDTVLRREDLRVALPSGYAVLVLTDLVTTHRQPPGFAPWLLGYAALAVALQVVGALADRRHRVALPAGHYGELRPVR
ncbi:hypothetical protein M8542_30725 [Amycolatopsis sp. OK19-0408]|uniref:Uncharacterized protein n=1 Tax=Amycolatopsis iheyensis TaxID=2945988 RepID=A0A9X2NG74_9PSEU|nr:hypothetical protein [Amycolatopsis iheyensis]MCR6487212.1 hypothetical protein [Amycolatopsis iheyensis]